MRRQDLDFILRIAERGGDVLVIGSQSILGTYSETQLPHTVWASVEADVAFLHDPDARLADMLDGAIGELSPFHMEHGFYGQGVEVKTATLPLGWEERTVPFPGHKHARCLDPHDLVISKLIAGREKDLTFASALIDARLISVRALLERARMMELESAVSERLVNTVQGFDRGATFEL
jgi:hypothetical protein